MPDILPGVGMPEIDAYGLLQGLNMGVMTLAIVMMVGVFAFIGYKKKWFFRFPTSFEVMKVENGALSTVDVDNGRRVLKKNKDGSIKELYYDIKRRNFKWYPPSFESSVSTKKGNSKFYVRELYPNKWEIIDPKSFVTGKAEDYKRTEGDELDSYFKNTQDDMAEIKYKLPGSAWDSLVKAILPILPIAVSVVMLIIFFSQVIFPMMDRYNIVGSMLSVSQENLNASMILLDKSTSYVEMLLRLNGYNVVNGTLP